MDQREIDRFQFAGQDLGVLLDHWAEHKPDHPFLIWEPRDGADRTWTYRQFRDDVDRVAAGLAQRGVGEGDKVLLHAENCPEMVLAWYGCARLGAVGVTTNTRSVGAEIEYFASHTGCVGAITQPQFARLVAEHASGLDWIVVTADDSGEPAAEAHDLDAFESLLGSGPVPDRAPDPLAPVGIMFTSGTTSRPKAVVHTHANALWASRVGPTNIAMGGDGVYLVYLPFFHVNAQSWSVWSTLGVGGTVVLQPKFSASRFWEVVTKHAVTHISLIPFVFKALAGQDRPAHNPLEVGVFGLVMPVLEGLMGCRVVPAYGMTETVIHAIHAGLEQHHPERSMGKPTAGYRFLVVDPESGELCDEGQVGELWIRGTRGIQLFLEYHDNPDANEAAFTDDGWFRTGDMVRVADDGNFFYSERDKDVLKVGGENVSAKEVEDACRAVPGIADIAVVAKSHDMLDQVAVAFVIKGADGPSDDELGDAILDHCAEVLADFKRPRAVYVVDEFPRATLDKVAKNKLRDQADAMPEVD